MNLRIATWNLNTWLNRRDKGISNTQLWQWADTNIGADVVVFTEAETPPPRAVTNGLWSFAHKPLGFPGVSKWGTVIAARTSSGVRVERITHVGDSHELDTLFPGTFTAADLFVHDECVATIVGLHLRYRKDKNKKFIGHPADDLDLLKKDFVKLFEDRGKPLIVTGDFNCEIDETPSILKKLCRKELALVDAFEDKPDETFEQDWDDRICFRIDYMYLSKILNNSVAHRKGGIPDFPDSLTMSDHAPLVIDVDVSGLLGNT